MSKSKSEFIEQVHTKSFTAWWDKFSMEFPLVHFADARAIYTAGRVEFEKTFLRQKRKVQEIESARRKLQSKMDKGLKNEIT